MKWIKKLFFGNAKYSPSDDDRISDFSVDEEGNISATVTLSVNGGKLAIPLSTNAEALEQIQRNKNNPNSCEREPAEYEIKIPLSEFRETCVMIPHGGSELGIKMFRICILARKMGYNNVIVSKTDYNECLKVTNV